MLWKTSRSISLNKKSRKLSMWIIRSNQKSQLCHCLIQFLECHILAYMSSSLRRFVKLSELTHKTTWASASLCHSSNLPLAHLKNSNDSTQSRPRVWLGAWAAKMVQGIRQYQVAGGVFLGFMLAERKPDFILICQSKERMSCAQMFMDLWTKQVLHCRENGSHPYILGQSKTKLALSTFMLSQMALGQMLPTSRYQFSNCTGLLTMLLSAREALWGEMRAGKVLITSNTVWLWDLYLQLRNLKLSLALMDYITTSYIKSFVS